MKLKVLLLIAQGFLRRKSVTNAKRIFPISGYHLKWERIQACSIFWYMTTSSCFEFSFSFSSDRATMYNTGTFKLAIG